MALGSQRFVESCHAPGQMGTQGESSYARPRPTLRQARSQSFGQLDALPLPPLSSAVSHPAIPFSVFNHPVSAISSSCLPSAAFHSSFQPLDPIPDVSLLEDNLLSSCSDSLGYPSFSLWLCYTACNLVFLTCCCFIYCFRDITHWSF